MQKETSELHKKTATTLLPCKTAQHVVCEQYLCTEGVFVMLMIWLAPELDGSGERESQIIASRKSSTRGTSIRHLLRQ